MPQSSSLFKYDWLVGKSTIGLVRSQSRAVFTVPQNFITTTGIQNILKNLEGAGSRVEEGRGEVEGCKIKYMLFLS